jgi:hypothetical protein
MPACPELAVDCCCSCGGGSRRRRWWRRRYRRLSSEGVGVEQLLLPLESGVHTAGQDSDGVRRQALSIGGLRCGWRGEGGWRRTRWEEGTWAREGDVRSRSLLFRSPPPGRLALQRFNLCHCLCLSVSVSVCVSVSVLISLALSPPPHPTPLHPTPSLPPSLSLCLSTDAGQARRKDSVQQQHAGKHSTPASVRAISHWLSCRSTAPMGTGKSRCQIVWICSAWVPGGREGGRGGRGGGREGEREGGRWPGRESRCRGGGGWRGGGGSGIQD